MKHTFHSGKTRRGWTLLELLVVITIIAVLAALLIPAFASVRNSAKQAVCASNLRQFGLASLAWAADHNGMLAPVMWGDPVWDNRSHIHGVRPSVYDELRQYGFESAARNMCPVVRADFKRQPSWTETSYSYNFLLGGRDVWYPYDGSGYDRQHGLRIAAQSRPSELLLFTDNYAWLSFNTIAWTPMLALELQDTDPNGVGNYAKAHPAHFRKAKGTQVSGYDNYVTLDGRGGCAYVTEETNLAAPFLRRPRWTDTRIVP